MRVFAVVQVVLMLAAAGLSWATPTLVKPTLPFGVRVPVERAREPIIMTQRRRYRALVAVTGAVVTVAALALGLAGDVTLLLPLLLLASLLLYWAYYYAAHRRIRQAKLAGGWYKGQRPVVVTDTRLRTDPPRFPWLWMLPSVLIVVVTAIAQMLAYPRLPHRIAVHYNASGVADSWVDKSVVAVFTIVVVQAAVTALIVGLSLLAFRAPADIDAEQPEVSAYRHRRYVVAMTRSLLCLAALVSLSLGLASVVLWQREHSPMAVLTAALAPTLIGAAVVVMTAVRVGQSGSRLAVDVVVRSAGTTRDDDANWRAGVLYVDRRNRALLVPRRFGVGWTLNFGHPLAWVIVGLVIVAAILPPVYASLTR